MSTTTLLRVALLASIGASGCAPVSANILPTETGVTVEPGPCGEHPRLTRDNRDALRDLDAWLVCGPSTQNDGSCPDAPELTTWTFLDGAIGPHSDPDFCAYFGTDVCGPVTVMGEECCYVMRVEEMCEGRPLVVGDEVRVAPSCSRGDWRTGDIDVAALSEAQRAAGGDLWLRAAAAEHASIASFARFVCELMHLGAPAELVLAATAAQADEVRHAAISYGVASAMLGRSVGPGGLDVRGAAPRTGRTSILVATLLDGCVNESMAAAEAREAARLCPARDLAQVLVQIADDETRHAALAWRTVNWMVQRWPELREVVRSTLQEAAAAQSQPADATVDDDGIIEVGRLSRRARLALRRRVYRDVIDPVAGQILHAQDPLSA